jgi:hypothetical protein
MKATLRLVPIVIALTAAILWMDVSRAEDPLMQYIGSGAMDWDGMTVMCTGIGAPNPRLSGPQQRPSALRAAKLDAMRQLLETLQGVYISSETTVEDYITTSDVIRSRVEGYLKGFRQVGPPRYMSDGTCELDVEASVTGALLETLLPPTGAKKGIVTPPPAPASSYTGFVFDCREVNVQFALSPRVLNEDGEEVYGPDWVDRDAAAEYGIVAYETEVTGNPRIGSNPFTISAQRTAGTNNCDVVVLNMDSAVLESCEENLIALDQCKVIFWVK